MHTAQKVQTEGKNHTEIFENMPVAAAEIFKAKKALSENGESVCAMSSRPDNMKFRKIYTVDGSGVRRVE